jgi:glutamate dehydrogenase
MSGDVFGNGMLLSEKIRLVAAFDHRDIFIDPDPDCDAGFAERKRLFDLGRSSWQDYDTSKLSKGGMIIPRTLKSVDLTPEAAAAIGLSQARSRHRRRS